MRKIREVLPVVVNLSVKNEKGRLVLVADGIEEVAQNYPSIHMTPKEEATWQKDLKNIIDNNEYYRNYC